MCVLTFFRKRFRLNSLLRGGVYRWIKLIKSHRVIEVILLVFLFISTNFVYAEHDAIQLTTDGGYYPSLAPDGVTVIYEIDGRFIKRVNIDGTGQAVLMEGRQPVVSPDGTKFIFTDPGFTKIMQANIDGTQNVTLLTALQLNANKVHSPSWNADGTKITFVTETLIQEPPEIEGTYSKIYVGDFDPFLKTVTNAGAIVIGNKNELFYSPTFSPDGNSLAYLKYSPVDILLLKTPECNVMHLDLRGGQIRQLTIRSDEVSCSPGSRIFYGRNFILYNSSLSVPNRPTWTPGVWVLDLTTLSKKPFFEFEHHIPSGGSNPAITPASKFVVFSGLWKAFLPPRFELQIDPEHPGFPHPRDTFFTIDPIKFSVFRMNTSTPLEVVHFFVDGNLVRSISPEEFLFDGEFTFDAGTFSEGTHTYHAIAQEITGQTSRVPEEGFRTFTVIKDSTPPTIRPFFPVPNQVLFSSPEGIFASVQDEEGGSGIDINSIKVFLNEKFIGSQVPVTFTDPLTAGLYTVKVTAADRSGNSATETWSFRVIIDQTEPTITIVSPLPGALLKTRMPLIKAILSDETGGSGIKRDTIVLEMDGIGRAFNFDEGTASLTFTPSPQEALGDGEHTVKIQVSDNVGNKAQQTWKFKVDATAPKFKIQVVPNPAKKGEVIIIVTPDEPLKEPPKVEVKDKDGKVVPSQQKP